MRSCINRSIQSQVRSCVAQVTRRTVAPVLSRSYSNLTRPAVTRAILRPAPTQQALNAPHVRYYATPAGDIVKVPSLGDSISEGTIGEIKKKVGDYVKVDEPVIALLTDKVTMDINAPESGIITEILVKPDETVPVGHNLFRLQKGAAPPAGAAAPKPSAPSTPTPSAPAPSASAPAPSAPKQAPSTPTPAPASTPSKPSSPSSGAASPAAAGATRSESRVKMTPMRKRVAERLKQSQNTAAMLTTWQECDMSAAFELRNVYGEAFLKKHGVKLGFMSIFTRAAVAALQEQPVVNGYIDGDEIVYRNYNDISVAVATPRGLVVPVLRNCEKKTMADVEKELGALGTRARNDQITLEDMAGGTFTISNGGIYGSLMGMPIINPPQSAILGMHGIFKRPVAINDKVEIRPMMYLALTYDHRLIDGREGVTFLKKVKEIVEDPRRLLLDL